MVIRILPDAIVNGSNPVNIYVTSNLYFRTNSSTLLS